MTHRKITRIHVVYFQGYVDTTVDLCGGINAFIGDSSSGKSTIACKAVEWVYNNTIAGDPPKKRGWSAHNRKLHGITKPTKTNPEGKPKLLGNTSVTIHFSDGHIVNKTQGKDACKYIITYPEVLIPLEENVNPLPLTASGATVPEAVRNVFKFNEVNHAHQFEGMFMIFETPGEIAKRLNKIVDMELPDHLLAMIKADKTKTKIRQTDASEEVKRLEKSLAKYDNLNDIESSFNTIATLHNDLQDYLSHVVKLQNKKQAVEALKKELSVYDNLEEQAPSLDLLKKLQKEFMDSWSKCSALRAYKDDMMYLKSSLAELGPLEQQDASLVRLRDMYTELTEDKKHINTLYKYHKEFADINRALSTMPSEALLKSTELLHSQCIEKDVWVKRLNDLAVIKKALESASVSIIELDTVIQKQQELYNSILREQGCPTCGKKSYE
jgi:hypothetical protein